VGSEYGAPDMTTNFDEKDERVLTIYKRIYLLVKEYQEHTSFDLVEVPYKWV
jgi:hypothetical protein